MSGLSMPERPERGRLAAGVCLGLSERLGFDVTLMRLAFVLLTFAWGLGALLYVALWLVMPLEGMRTGGSLKETARQNLLLARAGASRSQDRFVEAWSRQSRSRWPVPADRRWLGIGLLAAGLLVLLVSFGMFSWVTPLRALGLAAIALGIGALAGMRARA